MAEHTQKRPRQNRRTSVDCLLYVLAFVLAAQPIANDDLWWLVAHGQMALEGCLQPSSELVEAKCRESAWMAGIPAALCYELLGNTGLMLLKFLAAATLCCFVARAGRNSGWASALFCAIGLVGMSPVFEPCRMLWDALGVLLAWYLIGAESNRTKRNSLAFALLVVVWANSSYGVVWVLPVIAARSVLLRFTFATSVRLMVLSGICLSLTPRGIYTLADAGMIFLPVHLPLGLREGTPWQSIWQGSLSTAVVASFVAFAILLAASIRRRADGAIILLLLVVPMICCTGNLPVASLLLTLCSLKLMENKDVTQKPSFFQLVVTGGIIVCACVVVASGWNSYSGERLGWGVSSSLDYRFVQRDLQQARRLDGAAHCPNIRTAGILAFAAPDGFRPSTTPTIAILTGQWIEYSRLTQELLNSRRSSFRREDGTAGGWWRTVEDQSVTMLMVPADSAQLIRSLEPTLWKPLSLDSPVIPYVRTDHRQWTPQLAQMVQQRELVNYGNWQHTPNATTANLLHTDIWEQLTGAIDYQRDRQQAEAFRAMGLQTAAMRVLLPILSDSHEDVRHQFHQTQVALGLEEWKHAGVVSLFRQATIYTSALDISSLKRLRWLPNLSEENAQAWEPVVVLYMNGNCDEAIQRLSAGSGSESIYAALTLSSEAGDAETYDRLLDQMKAEFPSSPWLSFLEMNQP